MPHDRLREFRLSSFLHRTTYPYFSILRIQGGAFYLSAVSLVMLSRLGYYKINQL